MLAIPACGMIKIKLMRGLVKADCLIFFCYFKVLCRPRFAVPNPSGVM